MCACVTYGDLTDNQHCSESSHVSLLPVKRGTKCATKSFLFDFIIFAVNEKTRLLIF